MPTSGAAVPSPVPVTPDTSPDIGWEFEPQPRGRADTHSAMSPGGRRPAEAWERASDRRRYPHPSRMRFGLSAPSVYKGVRPPPTDENGATYMLPGQTRRQVDAIWDRIWASGVSNPLTAIEYFSTILLLRRLRDRQESSDSRAADGSTWLDLERYVADGDLDAVVSVMTRVQTQFGIGASPDVSTPATWRDLATLKEVLREVRNLDLTDRNHDILGDVFEYMLNRLSTAGHFGQFRTPGTVRFLVEAVDPRPGEPWSTQRQGPEASSSQLTNTGTDRPQIPIEATRSMPRWLG